MYVFILLCTLGTGFYLVLLVNLHNDGRRRRRALAGTVRTVKLGTVFELNSTSPERQA